MTFTDAFWKWFGDSKVVDGQGKPKVMYHGGGFEESDPEGIITAGLGAHFGTRKSAEHRMSTQHIDQEIEDAPIWEEDGRYFLDEDMWPGQPARGFRTEDQAKEFIANQMQDYEGPDDIYLTEAFLRIENPLTMPDLGTWQFPAIIRELREMGVFTAKDADRAYDAYNRSDTKGYHAIKALLMRKGFDGIRYRNAVEDPGKFSWIIFKPNQAKSVNNRGAWDRRSRSMMNPKSHRRQKSNPPKPFPPKKKKKKTKPPTKKKYNFFKDWKKIIDVIPPGSRRWFEYHCWEDPKSCDAEIWYRSHQKVKVLGIPEDQDVLTTSPLTPVPIAFEEGIIERNDNAMGLMYIVRFDDGLEWKVFEDELSTTKKDWFRPDPPKMKKHRNPTSKSSITFRLSEAQKHALEVYVTDPVFSDEWESRLVLKGWKGNKLILPADKSEELFWYFTQAANSADDDGNGLAARSLSLMASKILKQNPGQVIRPGTDYFIRASHLRDIQEDVYQKTGRWLSPAQIREQLREIVAGKLRAQIRIVK